MLVCQYLWKMAKLGDVVLLIHMVIRPAIIHISTYILTHARENVFSIVNWIITFIEPLALLHYVQ